MTSNIKLLSFDGNRYGGLPKHFTRKSGSIIFVVGKSPMDIMEPTLL